jgi:glutamine synthetase
MPKPIGGVNGSGMHTHQSIMVGEAEDRRNAFYDPKGAYQMSDEARYYIGGLLKHAQAFVAITNPLVNSYKRLVPGYEAPVNVAWSEHNRSPLVRVPARRGEGTRVEVRIPDPSCNPYLAFTVMLRSGLDGIMNQIDPGEPVNQNIFDMTPAQKRELNISQLPSSLYDAIQNLHQNPVMREALGDHICSNFVRAKEEVWREYCTQVHQWELDKYLGSY